MALESGARGHPVRDDRHRQDPAARAGCCRKLRPRPGVRIGKPLDFSRYEGMAGDRFVERSMTDEIMYELMQLSGQEYVDQYAAKVKKAQGKDQRLRRATTAPRAAATACRTPARPEPIACASSTTASSSRTARRSTSSRSASSTRPAASSTRCRPSSTRPARSTGCAATCSTSCRRRPTRPGARRERIRDDLLAFLHRAGRADRAVGLDGRPTTTSRSPSCGATCARCRAPIPRFTHELRQRWEDAGQPAAAGGARRTSTTRSPTPGTTWRGGRRSTARQPLGFERSIATSAATDESDGTDAHRSAHRRRRLPGPERGDPRRRPQGRRRLRPRVRRLPRRLEGAAGERHDAARRPRGARHPAARRHDPRLVAHQPVQGRRRRRAGSRDEPARASASTR